MQPTRILHTKAQPIPSQYSRVQRCFSYKPEAWFSPLADSAVVQYIVETIHFPDLPVESQSAALNISKWRLACLEQSPTATIYTDAFEPLSLSPKSLHAQGG